MASATCFGRYLTFENIPNRVAEVVVASIQSPVMFLLAMNILLLIIGMFMDIISRHTDSGTRFFCRFWGLLVWIPCISG